MYMAERLYELKNTTAEQQFLAENKQLKSQLEIYRLENFELRKNSSSIQRRCDAMERQLKASSKQNHLFKPIALAGTSSNQYRRSPPMISIPLAELSGGNSVTQLQANNQFVGALVPQNQQIKPPPAKAAAVNAVTAAKRFVNQLNLSESESSSESDSSSSDEEPEEKPVEAPVVLTVKVERCEIERIKILDNVLIQEASIKTIENPDVQPVAPTSSGTTNVKKHVEPSPIAVAATESISNSKPTNGTQEKASIGDAISSDVVSEAVAIEQLPAPPAVEVKQSPEEADLKKDVLRELVDDIIGDDSESSQSLVIDLKDDSDEAWKEIDNAIDSMKQVEAPEVLDDIDNALKSLLESGNGHQPESDQMEIPVDYDTIEKKLQCMEGSSEDDMKLEETVTSQVPESRVSIDKQSESEGELVMDIETDMKEVIAKPAQASIETQDDFEPDYEAEDD